MTTNRINNGTTATTPQLTNPLLAPKTDADKAKAAQQAAATGAVISAPVTSDAGDGKKPNYNVKISGDAKSRAEAHAKALSIARATPDVREDRVAALKKQVDEGTYKVDAGDIADGMLREAVKEHLANNER
jgi:negative regulator of flagellin synthesis FlgM